MSKKRITEVNYTESLSDNDSVFVNQGDILRQINKQDLFNVVQTQVVDSKFQFVSKLPANPDSNTYYFIPE